MVHYTVEPGVAARFVLVFAELLEAGLGDEAFGYHVLSDIYFYDL